MTQVFDAMGPAVLGIAIASTAYMLAEPRMRIRKLLSAVIGLTTFVLSAILFAQRGAAYPTLSGRQYSYLYQGWHMTHVDLGAGAHTTAFLIYFLVALILLGCSIALIRPDLLSLTWRDRLLGPR